MEYALTTTPVDGAKAESVDAEDASTYTPAMRFHARGGANPSRILLNYKTPAADATPTAHGRDIVVMRYARDENGAWPAKRPPMRVRSLGPLEERVLRTGRSLRVRALKAPRPKISLPSIHRPSLHAPAMPSLPHVSVPRVEVISRVKQGASRLRHRDGQPEDELPETGSEQVEGAKT